MGLQPAEGKWEGIFFPINFFVAIFMSIEKKCQEKIFPGRLPEKASSVTPAEAGVHPAQSGVEKTGFPLSRE